MAVITLTSGADSVALGTEADAIWGRIADITAVVAVDFARIVKVKPGEQHPNLLRWRAALAQRPAPPPAGWPANFPWPLNLPGGQIPTKTTFLITKRYMNVEVNFWSISNTIG